MYAAAGSRKGDRDDLVRGHGCMQHLRHACVVWVHKRYAQRVHVWLSNAEPPLHWQQLHLVNVEDRGENRHGVSADSAPAPAPAAAPDDDGDVCAACVRRRRDNSASQEL